MEDTSFNGESLPRWLISFLKAIISFYLVSIPIQEFILSNINKVLHLWATLYFSQHFDTDMFL